MTSASTESDGWGTAAKVFDGSETTMWHTQGDGPQAHWIKVDFIFWLNIRRLFMGIFRVLFGILDLLGIF